MTRSRQVLAWWVRVIQRAEDPTLRRFGNLRIDQSSASVPLFYARKSA